MATRPVHDRVPEGLATRRGLRDLNLVPRGAAVAFVQREPAAGDDAPGRLRPLYRIVDATPPTDDERREWDRQRLDRRERRAHIHRRYAHALGAVRAETLHAARADFRASLATIRTWVASEAVLIVHTRTTGVRGVVTDLAVTRVDGTVRVSTHVRPNLNAQAKGEHGVADAVLQHAPSWPELLPDLATVLSGHRVVAFDAPVHMDAIRRSADTAGGRGRGMAQDRYWHCVMRLAAPLAWTWAPEHETWRWPSLAQLCAVAGVTWVPGPHRAVDAALILGQALTQLAAHLPDPPRVLPATRVLTWKDVGWRPETHPDW